jgi:HAD superfamily hydrolase (TIGR01459 family)
MSSLEIPILPGIASLMERYDGVILDLWGVVHDGKTPYPGATATLARLSEAGKPVVMLSNAPRRADAVMEGMQQIGISRMLYTDVLSSGELAWRAIKERSDDWLKALGPRCLHIGPERDRGLFDGLDLAQIAAPEPGSFILNTGPWRDEETVEDYEDVLAASAAAGMAMICANPDMEVIRGGTRIICAGALAARYQELGGDVRSYGKPYVETYEACLRLMNLGPGARLIAIGDSLATDIRGANAAGIDAVLVTSGIHARELGLSFGESPDPEGLAAVALKAGVKIAAAIPAFHW